MRLLVLHGPNLNLLGSREPAVYGTATLADIDLGLKKQAQEAGADIDFMQSNSESALIDRVHAAGKAQVDCIILNPGAFTHTSIALRDAFLGVNIPFYEVHISNVHTREEFRRLSYFSDIARGVIVGLGTDGYTYALQAALSQNRNNTP